VLPFLWRDRIVGRADLKSERRDGSLVVKALHLEPGVRRSRTLDDRIRPGSRPAPGAPRASSASRDEDHLQ
jgi:hypothetical protein